MKVISGAGRIKRPFKNTVVAIGIFDGVHRGHQHLISQTVQRAKEIKGVSVVLTFFPHPVKVLRPEIKFSYLVSLPHRLRLIESLGVDITVVENFTRRFSRMTPEVFIRRVLVERLGAVEVFVGDDFRFGQDRRGDVAVFRQIAQRYAFRLDVVRPVGANGDSISSTRIRRLIMGGKLTYAERLLGRRVSVWGTVTRGDRRGRTLGYPTANVRFNSDVLPPEGVYLVQAALKKQTFPALANIGRCPSFSSPSQPLKVEVHLLDFKRNIYGQEILVEFIRKIRNEKTFSRQEDLIRQLKRDESTARRYFHLFPRPS